MVTSVDLNDPSNSHFRATDLSNKGHRESKILVVVFRSSIGHDSPALSVSLIPIVWSSASRSPAGMYSSSMMLGSNLSARSSRWLQSLALIAEHVAHTRLRQRRCDSTPLSVTVIAFEQSNKSSAIRASFENSAVFRNALATCSEVNLLCRLRSVNGSLGRSRSS